MVQRKEPWLSVPSSETSEAEKAAPPTRPARPSPALWRVFPASMRKNEQRPAQPSSLPPPVRPRRETTLTPTAPTEAPDRPIRMPSVRRSAAPRPGVQAAAPPPRPPVIVTPAADRPAEPPAPPAAIAMPASPAPAPTEARDASPVPPSPASPPPRSSDPIAMPSHGLPAAAKAPARPAGAAPRSPWARLGRIASDTPAPPAAMPAPATAATTPAPRPAAAAAGPPPAVQSLADLPPVSGSDWVQKVAEGARSLDVVVVFHSIAHSGSDAFQFAFHTMMQEILPRLGRPYVAYRFSLDAEPGFVTEMAECLGLPVDNAVTGAGLFWSGPRRRLSLIGDRAFESRAAFSHFLPAVLASQQARLPGGILPAVAPSRPAPQRAAPKPKLPPSAARRRMTAVALLVAGVVVAGALLASTVFDWHRQPPLSPAPASQATAQPRPPAELPPKPPRAGGKF